MQLIFCSSTHTHTYICMYIYVWLNTHTLIIKIAGKERKKKTQKLARYKQKLPLQRPPSAPRLQSCTSRHHFPRQNDSNNNSIISQYLSQLLLFFHTHYTYKHTYIYILLYKYTYIHPYVSNVHNGQHQHRTNLNLPQLSRNVNCCSSSWCCFFILIAFFVLFCCYMYFACCCFCCCFAV